MAVLLYNCILILALPVYGCTPLQLYSDIGFTRVRLDSFGATRAAHHQGVFELNDNIAFDNGINGVVVHKTNHANVKSFVERNILFNNGRTTTDVEGRQAAGGLVINQASAVTVKDVKAYVSKKDELV